MAVADEIPFDTFNDDGDPNGSGITLGDTFEQWRKKTNGIINRVNESTGPFAYLSFKWEQPTRGNYTIDITAKQNIETLTYDSSGEGAFQCTFTDDANSSNFLAIADINWTGDPYYGTWEDDHNDGGYTLSKWFNAANSTQPNLLVHNKTTSGFKLSSIFLNVWSFLNDNTDDSVIEHWYDNFINTYKPLDSDGFYEGDSVSATQESTRNNIRDHFQVNYPPQFPETSQAVFNVVIYNDNVT